MGRAKKRRGGLKKDQPTRVVYYGVTSSFFGIGILPVSDLTGRSVFWSVLLVWRELLFSAKGGLAVSKRGPLPPFFLKKGASAPFLRDKGVPAKKMIPKCTDQDFLRYQYGKYQENADGESEPNYWLGYSSRPRTDQHPPSLHPTKRSRKNQPERIEPSR